MPPPRGDYATNVRDLLAPTEHRLQLGRVSIPVARVCRTYRGESQDKLPHNSDIRGRPCTRLVRGDVAWRLRRSRDGPSSVVPAGGALRVDLFADILRDAKPDRVPKLGRHLHQPVEGDLVGVAPHALCSLDQFLAVEVATDTLHREPAKDRQLAHCEESLRKRKLLPHPPMRRRADALLRVERTPTSLAVGVGTRRIRREPLSGCGRGRAEPTGHGLSGAGCDSAHFLPWRSILPSFSSRSHTSLTVRLFTWSRSLANSFVLAAPRASSASIFSGNPTPDSRVPLVVLCSYAASSSSLAARSAPCQSGGLQRFRCNPGLVRFVFTTRSRSRSGAFSLRGRCSRRATHRKASLSAEDPRMASAVSGSSFICLLRS